MTVITGRFREARAYLLYVAAVALPGKAAPVFETGRTVTRSVERLSDDSLRLLIEEGRRQLDRQAADMNRNQSRATALLTIVIAELVFLFTSRIAVLKHFWVLDVLWWTGVGLGILAIAGCIAVTIAPASYGGVSITDLADGTGPLLAHAASEYVDAIGVGDATNAARLTVLRDAAWLAMLTGALLISITPFSK